MDHRTHKVVWTIKKSTEVVWTCRLKFLSFKLFGLQGSFGPLKNLPRSFGQLKNLPRSFGPLKKNLPRSFGPVDYSALILVLTINFAICHLD